MRHLITHLVAISLWVMSIAAIAQIDSEIDAYVRSLVESNNFSGQVLIYKGDEVLFSKNYGWADREKKIRINDSTIFQIASVSKALTTAAIGILSDEGKLSVNRNIHEFIPDFPHGKDITIHHLLTHSSGIPNINSQPYYASLEKEWQSAFSLLPYIKNLGTHSEFKSGTQYRYSNSNYNLLAYIIEIASGVPYGTILEHYFFDPLKMEQSGHPSPAKRVFGLAQGYRPLGVSEVERAREINWTVKTGNGSLFSNAENLAVWAKAFFGGKLTSNQWLKNSLVQHFPNFGYGWFIRPRSLLQQYHINGRSPGFTSVISYYPQEELLLVVLSNNYVPVVTQMSIDMAAAVLDSSFTLPIMGDGRTAEIDAEELSGRYQFGPDFYQPNKVLTVDFQEGYLQLDWGVLLNLGTGRFINRDYWSDVHFVRSADGTMVLNYDGHLGNKLP